MAQAELGWGHSAVRATTADAIRTRPYESRPVIDELRNRAIAEALSVARVGAWWWDFRANVGAWGPELYRLFERVPEDELFSYETFLQFVAPEDRNEFARRVEVAIGDRAPFTMDFRGLLPNGRVRWFTARGFVETDGDTAIGMIGTIQDIDDRRRAENALRESEHLLASILDNSPDPTFMKDREGAYLYVNPAWQQAVGRTRENILGHTDAEIFGGHTAETFREADSAAMAEVGTVHRQEFVWLNGEERTYASVKFPLLDANGEVMGVCGISKDITEIVKSQLNQREERQRIAADIHDDSVQVMASVALRLETLERTLEGDDHRQKLKVLRETVTASVDRLRKLMFDLNTETLEDQGIVAALQESLDQVAREHGLEGVVVDALETEPSLATRAALFRIAREAFINVVKHARARRICAEVETVDAGVRLLVADDGVGFDESNGSPEGHLGLSSIRSRAQMAGGRCRIESREGQGTTVEVWIPDSRPAPAAP